MSLRSITVAAVATLGLSLAVPATAGPLNEGLASTALAKSPGTLLIGHAMGGIGGGGVHFGGPMGGTHFGSPMGGMGFSPRMSMAPRAFAPRYAAVPHTGIHRFPGNAAVFHGRRGVFRHGHFFPFVGVGLSGYGNDWGGGSCYWNCRAAGYGPGYCSAYANNFCY